MEYGNFNNEQFVDSATLNNASALVSGAIAITNNMMTAPGIISPDMAKLSFSGLTVTADLPAPFGVLFGDSHIAQAHGTQTNADTQSYAVSFSSLVPASGSVTAYLLASAQTIYQNPTTIVGPPPGHPNYNPNFVPYTGYLNTVDSLALSSSTTAADNSTTFEIGRTTLTAGQTSITSMSTQYVFPAAPMIGFQFMARTAAYSMMPMDCQMVQTLAASGITLALPPAGQSVGLTAQFLASFTSGTALVVTSGSDVLWGAASGSVTSLTMPPGASFTALSEGGSWRITNANAIFTLQNGAIATVVPNATAAQNPLPLGQILPAIAPTLSSAQIPFFFGSSAAPGDIFLSNAPRGEVSTSGYFGDSPLGASAETYGWLTSGNGSTAYNGFASSSTWWFQIWRCAGQNILYIRQNINNSGFTPWAQLLDVATATATLAAINGSASEAFNVAQAATSTEAVPLAQAQADFAAINGSASEAFNASNLYASTGVFSNIAVFTSSGTWTAPAGVMKVKYMVLGGGGGGGAADVNPGAGGGGGAGGQDRGITDVTPGQQIAVTIGAGGTGGYSTNNGTAGGASSFGSFGTATGGGGGGTASSSSPIYSGGSGGEAVGGYMQISGMSGFPGSYNNTGVYFSGPGASSEYGAGGYEVTGAGVSALGYGAGGGGGANGNVGADGTPGIVVLEW